MKSAVSIVAGSNCTCRRHPVFPPRTALSTGPRRIHPRPCRAPPRTREIYPSEKIAPRPLWQVPGCSRCPPRSGNTPASSQAKPSQVGSEKQQDAFNYTTAARRRRSTDGKRNIVRATSTACEKRSTGRNKVGGIANSARCSLRQSKQRGRASYRLSYGVFRKHTHR